jgi:hypothetical protein
VATVRYASGDAAGGPAPVTASDNEETTRRLSRQRRRVRRLRLLAFVTSLVALISIVAVVGVVVYWRLYLLGPEAGTPFVRGPFLTALSTNDAAFAWSVSPAGPVQITAVGPDARLVNADASGHLVGLAPATRYAWTAAFAGRAEAAGAFTTAPTAATSPIRFAVIGDYGSGNDHEWAVGRVLAAQDPAFILTAGDNSYLVALPSLLNRNLFDPLRAAIGSARLWATFGEHDLFLDGGAAIIDALHLPGTRYTIRYGPVQVVTLGLQADQSAIVYAAAMLAQPGPSIRFVLVHRPIQPDNPILPVLRRAHVAAIFAGHLHRYERRIVGGLLELTAGTSGEGPSDAAHTPRSPDAIVSFENYGLVRVDISPLMIVYTFLDEQGRILDQTRVAR